jgi:thioredoxin-related protein
MKIKIQTRKEISSSGVEGRRIMGVSALRRKELPTLYLNQKPSAYLWEDPGYLQVDRDWICVDDFLEEARFQEIVEFLRACGERLHQINRELKAKRAVWTGDETFVI